MDTNQAVIDALIWIIPLGLIFDFFMGRYIGSVAQRKGKSYWLFFWLTFLSWLVMFILVLVLPEEPDSNSKPK